MNMVWALWRLTSKKNCCAVNEGNGVGLDEQLGPEQLGPEQLGPVLSALNG